MEATTLAPGAALVLLLSVMSALNQPQETLARAYCACWCVCLCVLLTISFKFHCLSRCRPVHVDVHGGVGRVTRCSFTCKRDSDRSRTAVTLGTVRVCVCGLQPCYVGL